VGGVAIQDGAISVLDLSWMVQDDDLGQEVLAFTSGVVLGVRADITSFDVLDRDGFNVESDVVTGLGFGQSFMMHFNGLNVSLDHDWGEGNVHVGSEDTGLNSSDWDRANTTDLVDILEWESQWLVCGSFGGHDCVQGLNEGWSFVPGEVGGGLQHIVTVPSGNWDEWNIGGVVTNFLQEIGKFSLNFVISGLGPVDRLFVHLVAADNHLFDTQGERQQGMFSGLAIFGNTSLEFTLRSGNHEDGDIGLGGTGNHILDEVSMSGGIDDGENELFGFEFPEGDINGDTSFSLSFKLVQHPGVFERTFSHFVSFFLELFNCSLINTTALEDQVTSGGGFS